MNTDDVNRRIVDPHDTCGSTSSEVQTGGSMIMTDLLLLGRKIASELGASKERDTTAIWMSHYLAECIERAESDETTKDECAEVILRIWNHRRRFPGGDPLGQYDKLLDPLSKIFRRQGRYPVLSDPRRPEDTANGWMDLAVELEQISSELIGFSIREAIKDIEQPDPEILKFADSLDPGAQSEYVKIVLNWLEEEPEAGEAQPDIDPFQAAVTKLRALADVLEKKVEDMSA